MSIPDFSAASRGKVLDRLASRRYDLLVVGGGITGAGVALDAASRGLDVALVERNDLASGTSSKSSKLVHGGLRYLEQRDFAIVRESLVERNLLRRLAPHLVRPLPFVVPGPPDRRDDVLLGVGLGIYSGLAGFRVGSRPRRLSPSEVLEQVPGLVTSLDGGGWQYLDSRTDDARLTMTVARTATEFGADVATRADVVGLHSAGGRVVGAAVRDTLSGRELDVAARVTLSATGVWADKVRDLAGPSPLQLSPSKGVHLVFPATMVRVRSAVVVASGAQDGRRVFIIPWGRQVVVGTTDDLYDGPLDAPTVDAIDADYCCTAVNTAFGLELTPSDAVGAWAGLRPLPRGAGEPGGRSDVLSRRHALVAGPPGLLTLTGGKLTTYRKMAEEGVNAVIRELGGSAKTRTTGIPLGLRGDFDDAVDRTTTVADALGVDSGLVEGLVERHGSLAVPLLERAAAVGETDRLHPDLPYLRAELRWAVEHELALSVDDVLRRRVRVALRDAAAGGGLAEDVAALLAGALGWEASQAAESVAEYRRCVAAERGVIPLAQPATPRSRGR